ncbi:hypothetical protein B7494_g5216 [Chlorociboria aeruginascens]|nr:hypothetical protein B7494_g5216 [Chlorociboria aeruginascens]
MSTQILTAVDSLGISVEGTNGFPHDNKSTLPSQSWVVVDEKSSTPRLNSNTRSPPTNSPRNKLANYSSTQFSPKKSPKSPLSPSSNRSYFTATSGSNSTRSDTIVSRFFNYFKMFGRSPPFSAIGQTMIDLPGGGLPPLFFPALGLGLPVNALIGYLVSDDPAQSHDKPQQPWVPDIEVQSKRVGKTGRRLWKEVRAVLDTACTAGNWVSLEVIQDLGITKYQPLEKPEEHPARGAGGEELFAAGAVDLTWHASPGQGIVNSARNFTMRFLITTMADPPFQILIGSEALWKSNILGRPVLHIGRHNTTVLPPEREGIQNGDYEERRARNKRLKQEALKKAEENRSQENVVKEIRADTPEEHNSVSAELPGENAKL